jgi:hypothetical protein
MSSTRPQDLIDEFTLELLRTGMVLFDLASDMAEGLPDDAYPDEESGAVVVEMVTGTIRTALETVNDRRLEDATDLIVLARHRVLEHLQLGLELRGRYEREERQQG